MNTKRLKNAIQRWGEYNVVMELKHGVLRITQQNLFLT